MGFLLFLLADRRIRIRTSYEWIRIGIRIWIREAQKHTDLQIWISNTALYKTKKVRFNRPEKIQIHIKLKLNFSSKTFHYI